MSNILIFTAQFMQIYPQAPEKFQERFDDLIEAMYNGEDWVKTCTLQILTNMAKDKPEVRNKRKSLSCNNLR